jgi:hypothetical protein
MNPIARFATIALTGCAWFAATHAAPTKSLPWKPSLAAAQDEARIRNIPILLYLGKDGDPG